MKKATLLLICILIISCSKEQSNDIAKYHILVNKAELLICKKNYSESANIFNEAFKFITKPFGSDVYNAALVCQLSKRFDDRDLHLQKLINNSNDLDKVQSTFVNSFITKSEWGQLLSKKKIEYDSKLRKDFKEIEKRDQLFRPDNETHDDTINENRKINLNRILELNKKSGFPSQIELGYTDELWGQKHDIVLHHTSQRRSYDKTVIDLESILYEAVKKGRFDPEKAIFFLNFQNDSEKEYFEVYSTWCYRHPSLPDSLNNKVWLPNLTKLQIEQANSTRTKWFANTLEDIATKSNFISKSDLPFIFTSVRRSISNMKTDFDKEEALSQYRIATSTKIPYE